MPCFHPLPAWRSRTGTVSLGREPPDSEPLRLPCGSCLGCRTSEARAWALRCHLENQQHPASCFTTLTYADDPKILWKPDLQLWLKRLRKKVAPTRVRFFASGEYGERFARPHFHALLFGIGTHHRKAIEETWGHGYTHTVDLTPAAIAYVAGYCQKKIDYRLTPQTDPETGEVIWTPPFREMSRRPGIGGEARQLTQSWRRYAVYHGQRIPVPRYLHEAWKAQATPREKEELQYEKLKERALRETLSTDETKQALRAAEALAVARKNLRAANRKYG